MIPDIYYYSFFLILVTLFTIPTVVSYIRQGTFEFYSDTYRPSVRSTAFLTISFFVLIVGFTPMSPIFADMPEYYLSMLDHRFEGRELAWDKNFVFTPFMAFMSSIGVTPRGSIFTLVSINYLCTYRALSLLFPNHSQIAILAFLSAFSTFGYSVNGMKAGCATAFFLLALARKDRKWECMFLLVISMGIHHSMQMPIIAFIVCLFVKNPKYYFYFWVFSFFMALFHIKYFQVLMGNSMSDQHGASYLLGDGSTINTSVFGGFRIDFILYSAVPIVIGYWAILKKYIYSGKYYFLLNLYMMINGVWMLCMYSETTYRIAYLSWCMYPVMLLYPVLCEDWGDNNGKTAGLLLLWQLTFTLFLKFIYGA